MCGTITGGRRFRGVGGEKEARAWWLHQRLWLSFQSLIYKGNCVLGLVWCRKAGPIHAWPLITVLLIYCLYSAVSLGVQTKAGSLALLLFLIVLFTRGVGASAPSAGSRALASSVNLVEGSEAGWTLTRCFGWHHLGLTWRWTSGWSSAPCCPLKPRPWFCPLAHCLSPSRSHLPLLFLFCCCFIASRFGIIYLCTPPSLLFPQPNGGALGDMGDPFSQPAGFVDTQSIYTPFHLCHPSFYPPSNSSRCFPWTVKLPQLWTVFILLLWGQTGVAKYIAAISFCSAVDSLKHFTFPLCEGSREKGMISV